MPSHHGKAIAGKRMDNKLHVLFWAALKPLKFGSLEDYILKVAETCKQRNLEIKFILELPIDPQVQSRFDHAGLDYELLAETEHSKASVLLKYLRKHKPRYLHLHFYGAGTPLILWTRLFSSAKIIVHDHNSRDLPPAEAGAQGESQATLQTTENASLLQKLKRNLFAILVHRIVAVSAYVEQNINQEIVFSSNKSGVIYNGVDTDRFHPVSDEEEKKRIFHDITGQQESRKIACFIGNLSIEKGTDVLLDVISSCHDKRLPVCFLIIGDGVMREQIENMCNKPGYDNIYYLGMRNDVDRLLRCSDIFIAPYRWGEAFGLTLIEAAASGLPVIATSVGAIPEVLGNNEGSICIKPGSEQALTAQLAKLVTDNSYCREQGKLARQRVVKNFDIRNMVSNTIALYR